MNNSKYNLELLRDSINSKIVKVLSKLSIINTKEDTKIIEEAKEGEGNKLL